MSRKMVLVPEAMLLELKGKLPKSPEFQATIGLGHQSDHIQGREDLNPEEKVALYGHQLHRYRNFSKLEEQVIKSVSKQMQKRAGLLLDHLQKKLKS